MPRVYTSILSYFCKKVYSYFIKYTKNIKNELVFVDFNEKSGIIWHNSEECNLDCDYKVYYNLDNAVELQHRNLWRRN